MDRKRSTIQDYRGYLSRHLEPFFGETPVNQIDGARVSRLPEEEARRRPVEQDRPEPPELPARRVRVLAQARLGDEQPGRARGPPKEEPLSAPPRPLPAARRARRSHRRGPRRSARPGRGAALPRRCADRAAPGRAARAEVDGRRLARRADTRSGQLHAGEVGQPQVPCRVARCRWPTGSLGSSSCAFSARPTAQEEDLVFCHPTRAMCSSPSRMRKRFREAITGAGVREITFHELRHTSAPRWPRRARRCVRSRSGWATLTPRRPRSTGTMRPTPPTGRTSWSERSGHPRTRPHDCRSRLSLREHPAPGLDDRVLRGEGPGAGPGVSTRPRRAQGAGPRGCSTATCWRMRVSVFADLPGASG